MPITRSQIKQSVIYELTKEDVEEIILDALIIKIGQPLPFTPNKVTLAFSDPANGVYQLRLEFDETLPQVLPLRGPPQGP